MIRDDVATLLESAVRDGLDVVQKHVDSGGSVPRQRDYPKMHVFDSGFPGFARALSDEAPSDYSSLFGSDRVSEGIPSWKAFADFAIGDERLSSFWQIRDEDIDSGEFMLSSSFFSFHRSSETFGAVAKLVDRFVHVTGGTAWDPGAFSSLYEQWERAVFLERLPVDLLIPIICARFDFDNVDVDERVSVERMSDPIQLARNTQHEYTSSAHEVVIGAATHAFVLRGWSVENETKRSRDSELRSIESYRDARKIADHLFAALRCHARVLAGYGQIIARPVDWCDWHRGALDLLPVVGVREYPDRLEHYGWLYAPDPVPAGACTACGKTFRALATSPKGRLALAARRLNLAHLRRSEEDSVLDITIGLEVLLVPDSGQGEIAHKLATRAAALSCIRQFEGLEPSEVFSRCKRLYAYRSAVAHGSEKRIASSRKIAVGEEAEISTVSFGIDLLRHAVVTLAEHPEYTGASALDKVLLERAAPGAGA